MRKSGGEILLFFGIISFSLEWYFIRKLNTFGFSTIDAVFGRLFYSCIFFILIYSLYPIFSQETPGLNTSTKTSIKEKILIALMGIDAIATNFLFNYSIEKTSVANVLVLFYTSIFWGSILGVLFFKEKIGRKGITHTLLAFVGITLSLADYSKLSIVFGVGEWCAFLASVTFSFEIIMARGLKNTPFFKRMIGMYIVGSLFSVTIILFESNHAHIYSIFSDINFLLYGGLFALSCGVIGKGLSYLGINKVSVNKSLLILLLEPIAQMITAYFIAKESISLINTLGICIVFIAVFMTSRQETPPTTVLELEAR